MSWLGWLFLLAGLYVLVAAVRGLVQIVSWLIDEYVIEPRAMQRPKEEPPQRPEARKSAPPQQKPDAKQERRSNRVRRRPSPWGKWLKSLKTAVARKGFDYWVACALAEDDRQAKVRHLSKALQLNPTYHPAWGMKGNALFELGKYDEAIECFNRSLELHASALVWYRKGLCCYHKGQRRESLPCFDKALNECPAHDRPLLEDVTRMKRLVEEELRCAEAT
jgi:tetratricopeptide (TPR) repeat protein